MATDDSRGAGQRKARLARQTLSTRNSAGPIAVYGHIHRPFIRKTPGMIVVNTGSVSLAYDNDPRASYLLLDETTPIIRRVEYDVEKEIKMLAGCGLPHANWIARILESGSFQMPLWM